MDKFPRKGERENASDENHNTCRKTHADRPQAEINYYRAEKMAKKMLDKGLITDDEYDRILAECRRIFVPFLAELM